MINIKLNVHTFVSVCQYVRSKYKQWRCSMARKVEVAISDREEDLIAIEAKRSYDLKTADAQLEQALEHRETERVIAQSELRQKVDELNLQIKQCWIAINAEQYACEDDSKALTGKYDAAKAGIKVAAKSKVVAVQEEIAVLREELVYLYNFKG